MSPRPPQATAVIGGHPIHAVLVGFPIAAFVGALLTDITYWRTVDLMWSNFSVWLITAGLFFGVLAAIAGMIDFGGHREVRSQGPAWPHAIGNALALILAFFNALVHSRDGYTAVVPTGLILSLLVVLIMGVTSWLGSSLVFRHRVGVKD
jgi:uncharacterized membrane protein